METRYEKSPFLKIVYLTINDHSKKSFLDYDFFLVLEGTMRISKDKETFFLGKDDIFLFEPGYEYHISSAGNNVILSIVLDSRFFLLGRSPRTGHYVCNSAADSSRSYRPLRQLLMQIAYTSTDTSEAVELHLTSHAYRLLYYLNTYHYEQNQEQLTPTNNKKYQERITNILNYIHHNYATPITLQEAADSLHLSAPYLSAFFKQNMNLNFNTYVNQVRLKHAVDDLIYTEKSITAITFDNGFASMNAFNKLFKEKYQTTPHRYRLEKREERLFQPHSNEEIVRELSSEDYQYLLEDYGQPVDDFFHDIQFPFQETIEVADMHTSTPVAPIWKTLLNVGPLSRLSQRYIEKQLAGIQESVGFSHARIEYALNPQLFLTHTPEHELFNFAAFDFTIDILRMQQLVPYLDLSIPIEQLSTNSQGEIVVDLEQYISLLASFIRHNANMYGPDFMETWYFEISPHRRLSQNEFESPESFANRFLKAHRLIKTFLPNAKVGGICHDVILPFAQYRTILELLKEQQIIPDFLSLGIFPYESLPASEENDSPNGMYYTRDTSYALHKVTEFKKLLSEYYDKLPSVHIAYLAVDFFHGHYLNDTCFQSTFLFHNTVDLIEEVDMLGYYQLSDIASQEEEISGFLDGRTGLFNKYGIRKPGCHLLDVFSNCRNNLVQKSDDFVILKGAVDRYMIGLCNYTYVNELNSFTMHHKIPIEDAYKVYESPKTKNVELKLHNLAPGEYDIILFQINPKHGSALDEWARNGYWNRFSREELEYMRKILQPLRTYYVKTSNDGTMQFQFQIAPHEVIFIVLLWRW